MNVLFLDQFSVMGGAQRGLLDVVDAAIERGWSAHAVIPGSGPVVEQLRARNVNVEEIPCGPYHSSSKSAADFGRFALDVRQQKRILANLVSRTRFDLVYVNGPRLLPAAALAIRRTVPVIFHSHSRLIQRYAVGLAGWSIRRSDMTVIACSHYVAQPLARYVRKGSIHIVPNGTADAGFRERAFGPGRSWRIGMIGRISPEKGQAEFLQAIGQLAPKFPTARFVICGAPILPVGGYLDLVSSLARSLPVEFFGWRDDVAAVLADLDLLVVPSKEEGMGRVLAEAFSAGVPAVAFATGGIPEVVSDEETGFLVMEMSHRALAARIGEVMTSDGVMISKVVSNARRKWEQLYRIEEFQKRITDLVERLASEAKNETAAPPGYR